MAMLALTAASQARQHKKGCLGCGVMLVLPLALLALLGVTIVSDDTPARATGLAGVTCAPGGADQSSGVAGYSGQQLENAAVIVAVGKHRDVPKKGWVVAVTAAMQESGLRNLDHGDRDSLGLFQERPSQGWGTPQQIMNPRYSTTQFYRHLQAVPDWQGLPVPAAAQAVERSAFPGAYARHVPDARQVVGAVIGATCTTTPGVPLPPNPKARTVVKAALSQLGVPYAWGGGTADGPSPGSGVDTGVVGFDCSGLALYAYAQIGVAVPHQTQAIWHTFQPAITSPADVRPADLVLLSNNGQGSGAHHVAIYLGHGDVVEAPHSGAHVRITHDIWQDPYWSSQFIGAVRPGVT